MIDPRDSSIRIQQAYISPSINFFKKNFLERYNLSEYHDTEEPALFFGLRGSGKILKNHKGLKLLLPCTPNDYPLLSSYENTIVICSEKYKLPEDVVRKCITPQIKDYSLFKPNILGEKIYAYTGFKNGWNLRKKILDELQKKIDFEIITTDHQEISNYYDIFYLKKKYYDKTFLNLNFTEGHGLTTTIELGLMGRKTIFNNNNINNIQRLEFPNFLSYRDLDEVVEIINSESKKIGTIPDVIDAHNVSNDEWLYLNFYL